MNKQFGITITAKMRHAALWKAAKECGSQAALARRIGVRPDMIGSWINLKGCPNKAVSEKVEQALFELTGQTIDELFPKELRDNTEFLSACKSIERTRDIETHMLGCQDTGRLLLPGADEEAIRNLDAEDMHKSINKVLKTLCHREREILTLRFGLNGHDVHGLAEVAKMFEIGKERVRQIEAKAIRKIMVNPDRRGLLERFVRNDYEPNDELTPQDWEEWSSYWRGKLPPLDLKFTPETDSPCHNPP